MEASLQEYRLTTAFSDLDHHNVQARDRHPGIEVSARAPHEWRLGADAGRQATAEVIHASKRFCPDHVASGAPVLPWR